MSLLSKSFSPIEFTKLQMALISEHKVSLNEEKREVCFLGAPPVGNHRNSNRTMRFSRTSSRRITSISSLACGSPQKLYSCLLGKNFPLGRSPYGPRLHVTPRDSRNFWSLWEASKLLPWGVYIFQGGRLPKLSFPYFLLYYQGSSTF